MSRGSRLEIDLRLPFGRFELTVSHVAGDGVTGVFGASGAGKSTLLQTIAGLRGEARGRLVFDGDVWLDSDRRLQVPARARGVGYVPQEGLLFPHWSVKRNLLAGWERARAAGQTPDATLARVATLLELEPLLDRSAADLSGGERQRVALGRALCSGARLLLLDEPFAALDLPLRRRLLPYLSRIRAELTVPMLFVSHDPIEVQALCDDLLVLRQGRVVAHGEPRRVLSNPEVFPLAERAGFENLLRGRLERRPGAHSVVELSGGARLVVLPRDGLTDGEVLVGLPATDLLIATERPRGLSARNALPATVSELRPLERSTLVLAELVGGSPPLTIEVTEKTPVELGLEVGGEVYLVIKAASCRLYPSTAG